MKIIIETLDKLYQLLYLYGIERNKKNKDMKNVIRTTRSNLPKTTAPQNGWDKRTLNIDTHAADAWMYEKDGKYIVYINFHSIPQEDYRVFIFNSRPALEKVKKAIAADLYHEWN